MYDTRVKIENKQVYSKIIYLVMGTLEVITLTKKIELFSKCKHTAFYF